MKKVWRKKAALGLALTLTAGLLLSCGGKDNDEKPQNDDNKPQTDDKSGGDQSAESGSNKLTIAIQQNSFVNDYKDNYLTKKLEEELDCELEFDLLPQQTDDIRTKISLLVTAGSDMPDVFITGNVLSPEAILDYGTKGTFLDLTDRLNDKEQSPNFHAIPEEDRAEMLSAMTSADGKIYGLASYEPETWNLTPYRFYMNEAWLKKVGKEIPTTTDEYYEALLAFKEQDPNGNGIQDELGAYGYTEGTYGQNITMALMNSFVFYNGGNPNGGLALDSDGKTVIAPYTTDGWKKGVEFLKKLYDEQLLAASVFTDDDTQFKANLNAETPVVGSVTAGSTSAWTDVNENPNFAEMTIIKPLKGPDGIAYTPYSEYTPTMAYFISSTGKNNNPDLAYKLGEYFYKHEISLSARFGEKGVDWTDDPEVCKEHTNDLVYHEIYDKITTVQLTNIWAENSSQFWHNVNPRYSSLEEMNTSAKAMSPYNPDLMSQTLNSFCFEHYVPAHPEHVLPLLKYTPEEASAVTEPLTNVPDHAKKTLAQFVTGSRPLEDWDAYVEELNMQGLQELITNAQTAYDRMGN